MAWTKPAYTDLRIGFEVTTYFASRQSPPWQRSSTTPRISEAFYFQR